MTDPVKAHCPNCDGERTCDVHGTVYVPWTWEDNQGHGLSGGVDHSLLQCRGCETVFYEHNSWNSEDIYHWHDHNGDTQSEAVRTKVTYPKPEARNKPKWIDGGYKLDDQLTAILNEMYLAHENSSHILTAVGLRTALDRATEVLGIDPGMTFDEKLDKLRDGGWIGETEREILGVVTDAGNAAAHRGWSPDREEVSQLLIAMEIFLQKAFVVGTRALSIKASIPVKQPRKRTAKMAST